MDAAGITLSLTEVGVKKYDPVRMIGKGFLISISLGGMHG
jgi:hypothetical protein